MSNDTEPLASTSNTAPKKKSKKRKHVDLDVETNATTIGGESGTNETEPANPPVVTTEERKAIRKQNKQKRKEEERSEQPLRKKLKDLGATPRGPGEEQEQSEANIRPSLFEIANSASKSLRKGPEGSNSDSPEESQMVALPTKAEVASYLQTNSISLSEKITPFLSFDHFNDKISPELKKALSKFSRPTPIQACTWPALLDGKDVVGIAETGSGKTLAFGLPAMQQLITKFPFAKKKTSVSVLVVAPTRELAVQTHETLAELGKPFGIGSVCLFGGLSKDDQKQALKGSRDKTVRIAVGTPGRILDLAREESLSLKRVDYLVLDEADRMLDKGFENDIRAIIGHTADPSVRQTVMFSATWPESVRRLANTFLRDPVRVTVGSDDLTANRKVEQVVEVLDDARLKDSKLQTLLRSLKNAQGVQGEELSRTLVFVLYKKEAARVENTLRRWGYNVGGIHGDLGQAQRLQALESFKSGNTNVLVATDVAARGLDIPNVGTVINYSFPLTIEDYIHRIGRTGRGGKSGKSVTFFTGDNHERGLAGELMRVLKDSGFTCDGLLKFPMTVKKKEHSAYGAWYKETRTDDSKPTKIKFA